MLRRFRPQCFRDFDHNSTRHRHRHGDIYQYRNECFSPTCFRVADPIERTAIFTVEDPFGCTSVLGEDPFGRTVTFMVEDPIGRTAVLGEDPFGCTVTFMVEDPIGRTSSFKPPAPAFDVTTEEYTGTGTGTCRYRLGYRPFRGEDPLG